MKLTCHMTDSHTVCGQSRCESDTRRRLVQLGHVSFRLYAGRDTALFTKLELRVHMLTHKQRKGHQSEETRM